MIKTYALELEDGCWYVGKTEHYDHRIKKHFSKGGGTAWTRLHRPVKVACVKDGDCEKDMYYYAAGKYGKDKVRGYAFCQTK